MTLVGKIFTVLIFVMSLVFMAFAVAVYATHKNWKEVVTNEAASPEKPLGFKKKLDDAKEKRNQLQTANDKLEKDLNLEKVARNQALQALQSQLVTSQDLLAKEIAAHNQLKLDSRSTLTTLDTNATTTARLTAEVEKLRSEIRIAHQERDEQFKKVVALVDELQQRQGDLARLKERELQLAQQLALWEKARVTQGWGSVESILAGNKGPGPVKGEILAVSPEGRLIEISIGSDDGLKEGHMLEVYRGGTYLGRMVVRRTKPDRSVGEMLPNKLGDVRAGDKVTSNKA